MWKKWMALKKTTRSSAVTYAIVIAAYLVIQLLSSLGLLSSLFTGLLVPLCTYVILAVSLNLVVGFLGELSLGHAGFMCVGAFASAFFSRCMEDAIPVSGLRFLIALLIGAAVAGLFGILIGIPVLRLKGDYLAIVTLAFGEIIKNLLNAVYLGRDSRGFHFSMKDTIALGLEEDGEVLIKGAQGITGTSKDATFVWGFLLVMFTLFVVLNLVHSRTGRAIMSIRDNRIAAESVGINVTKYKMIAFVTSAALAGAAGALFGLSAALAGMAGVLYAHNISPLTASKFDYNTSILILVFVVLGGIGSIRGSIIAAALLTVLPEMLRGFDDYRMLVYAIVLIAMMIFNQSPKLVAWRERTFGRRAKGAKVRKGGA